MVQDPTPRRWTTVPSELTVHCPPAAKLTGRPELAVAETGKSGSPYDLSDSALKVIVWLALVTAPSTQLSASPKRDTEIISAQLRQGPTDVPVAWMVIVFVSPGRAAAPLTTTSVADVGAVPVVVAPWL